MARAESTVQIDASPDKVMAVISDFERYPEFLPEIKVAEVLERSDDVTTVRFELRMLMKVSYTLRLTQVGSDSLSWELVDSKLLKKNSGAWQLKADEGDITSVNYTIDLELAGKLPASVNQKMAGQALPETLARFKSRVESL